MSDQDGNSLPMLPLRPMNDTTISILGCGWFGRALATHLVAKGYTVKGSITSQSKLEALRQEGNLIHLHDCIGLTEAVIHRPDIPLINGVAPDYPDRIVYYRSAAEREGLTPPIFNGQKGEYKLVHTFYPHLYRYQVNDWLEWLKADKYL